MAYFSKSPKASNKSIKPAKAAGPQKVGKPIKSHGAKISKSSGGMRANDSP